MKDFIKKVNEQTYLIDDMRIYRFDDKWNHAVDRIDAAFKKAKDHEEFKKQMVTRLRRIKHATKLYYAIAVLHEKGFDDIAAIYDGKLIMDKLTEE